MLGSFHNHTTYSDGTCSANQVLAMYENAGFTHLAITDHDNAQVFRSADLKTYSGPLKLITGIEFSTSFNHHPECHILGLGINGFDERLLDYETDILEGRRLRAQLIMDRMKPLGVQLTQDEQHELLSNPSVGRPHLAQILVNAGVVDSIESAFKVYLKHGKPLYVKKRQWDVRQVIQLIHDLRGLAILAHPGRFFIEAELKELVKFGLDGIEVYHPMHTPEETHRWKRLAGKYGLVITGGSDFHGLSPHEAESIGKSYLCDHELEVFLNKLEEQKQ